MCIFILSLLKNVKSSLMLFVFSFNLPRPGRVRPRLFVRFPENDYKVAGADALIGPKYYGLCNERRIGSI